ncbi:MAG TPA: hypothetical protein VM537_23510 [Anaerolineae bacterium]|nr:hypothetical protein [Anaerolineae bacterium]
MVSESLLKTDLTLKARRSQEQRRYSSGERNHRRLGSRTKGANDESGCWSAQQSYVLYLIPEMDCPTLAEV